MTNTGALRRVVGIVAMLSLGLAACGSESNIGVGDAGDDTTETSGDGASSSPAMGMCVQGATDCVDTVVNPNGDRPMEPGEARIVTAKTGQADVHKVDWEGFSSQGDDDRHFLVTFWGGVEPCFVFDHVDVVEADETVTITVYAGSSPEAASGDVACIELAEYLGTEITLAAPLGGRSVIDGVEPAS